MLETLKLDHLPACLLVVYQATSSLLGLVSQSSNPQVVVCCLCVFVLVLQCIIFAVIYLFIYFTEYQRFLCQVPFFLCVFIYKYYYLVCVNILYIVFCVAKEKYIVFISAFKLHMVIMYACNFIMNSYSKVQILYLVLV